jgi:hypothetical protein
LELPNLGIPVPQGILKQGGSILKQGGSILKQGGSEVKQQQGGNRVSDDTTTPASFEQRRSARLANKANQLKADLEMNGWEQIDGSKVNVVDHDYKTKEVHFVYALSPTSDFGAPGDYAKAVNGQESVEWQESL